jgi:hypothetical protein
MTAAVPAPYDVFVSYNWRDREAVERVARALRESGLNAFLDRWYLVPGEPWQRALETARGPCTGRIPKPVRKPRIHGWTPITLLLLIRVYPCPSVANPVLRILSHLYKEFKLLNASIDSFTARPNLFSPPNQSFAVQGCSEPQSHLLHVG